MTKHHTIRTLEGNMTQVSLMLKSKTVVIDHKVLVVLDQFMINIRSRKGLVS